MRIGGGGSIDYNQLQTDSVTFRNKDYTSSQSQAFFGIVKENPSSGNNSTTQLYNPAGSAIITLVDEVICDTVDAIDVIISIYNTALSADDGNWTNKNNGASAGVSELRSAVNSGELGTRLVRANVLANTPFTVTFSYPVILGAEEGLIVTSSTVNKYIGANFQGREV